MRRSDKKPAATMAHIRRLSPFVLGRRAAQHGLLGLLATGASILACYGVLALVGALGLLGTTMNLDPALWTAFIVLLVAFALLGLALNARAHRRIGPLLFGTGGALIGSYDWRVEAAGFAAMLGAALWDRRVYRIAIGC
jgi:hypothetical protein